MMTLGQVAEELMRRQIRLFCRMKMVVGHVTEMTSAYADDPHWKDLILFYE